MYYVLVINRTTNIFFSRGIDSTSKATVLFLSSKYRSRMCFVAADSNLNFSCNSSNPHCMDLFSTSAFVLVSLCLLVFVQYV